MVRGVSDPAALRDALDGQGLRVRRPSAAELAADAIRRLILGRVLAPGETLRETELSSALGVSRNTLREALRMVAREGLIVPGARRVATVAVLSVDDALDVVAARTVLECGAVDLARKRDLTALRRALATLHAAPEVSWQAVIDADRDFHTELVALAGSPRLDAAYALLDAEIRRTMTVTTRAYDDPGQLEDEHAQILEALERRTPARAKALLREHFAIDAGTLARVLAGDAEPPPTPTRHPS
jgi:DNA-binding GntR family transcriptional regulator